MLVEIVGGEGEGLIFPPGGSMNIFWNYTINLMTVKVFSYLCLKDECDQNQQDQMNNNQGFGLKKKGAGKRESAQDTGSILKLAANDKWATQKSKPQQRAKVEATKSGGKC